MSYSLFLSDIGQSKLASAISGGPKVDFDETIFSSSLPIYTGTGPGTPTNISYAIYSNGGFVPGFKGWAIQISGGAYGSWDGGGFNGLYVEDFPGLPDGYYPATYSPDHNALLIPAINPSVLDGSTELGGWISESVVAIDPNALVSNEVARASISSVTAETNVVTLQSVVGGASGAYYIRSMYVTDIDGDIIAAAQFPETYKPAGFEGGASILTVNAKINLASIEEGVTIISEDAEGSVRYDIAMSLEPEEQAQSRDNIGIGAFAVKDAAIIYATDYGVTADGTTDDTAALQNAVTAACTSGKPGILKLPPGTIKITAEISLTANILIRGSGGIRTFVRQYTAGANGFVATQAHYHMGFEDFSLIGPDATTGNGVSTGVGLLLDSKTHPGQYIGGPMHVKNMTIARWHCPLRVAQIHFLCENTRIGSYTKGVILMSTDVFLFHGCAIGAENEYGPTVSTCTSITMLGATIDAYVTSGGGNFAGTFLACEIGGAWRILETDDQAKVRFQSCNVECGNSFSGGSEKLFAIKGGARVEVSDCRFGIAFTTGESGTETTPTPASIFGCDATNAAAASRLVLKNNVIDSGSFYNVLKIVGDQWGDNYPEVTGKSAVNLKAYNAAGTLKATIPFYSTTFVSRDRIYMEFSTPATHAASVTRRGLFNIRQADDGDSTAGDDIPTFTRKTRKSLSGVVQYSRDFMLPCMLSEVLVSSSTTTANGASATETALPAYTVPNGQLIGNGDRFKVEFRGTCVANANTKTLEYFYGGDSYAALTINNSTATAWWLTVDVFGDAASILRGSVHLIAADSSGAIVINKRVRVSKGSSDGDKAVSMKISSAATSDITTEGWCMVWTNGAKKY